MKRAKASEELVSDIKRSILGGKYAPGSQLPSERALAEKYKVSRVPVREAIETLVKEQILYTVPHVGTFVTKLLDVELLSHNMYDFSRSEKKILTESLKTRQLIESECAALAALHASNEEIKLIQEALFRSTDEFRRLKQKKQNKFFKEDYEFHLAIAKASHSEILYQFILNLKQTISIHQFCSLQREDSINVVPDMHFKIYNAILSGDAEAARAAMFSHLQRTTDFIL